MAATWQTVRVFISSTFRDMQAERDHLVKVVFPQLRESLEKDRIHLVDIDLRWGVTTEQADNDLVLDLCLKQIDTCRPFFVGILGERYGWVPKQFPIEARKRFGWIQHHTGKSLTELEILHGVLNDPAMHDRAIFCFRSPSFIPQLSDEQRKIYCEAPTEDELRDLRPQEAQARAEDRRRKLRDLKTRIIGMRPALAAFDNYPCRWDVAALDPVEKRPGRLAGLEEFGQWVRVQLEKAIRTAPELQAHFVTQASGTRDELVEELDYHERLIESRLRVYVGRETIYQQLLAHLESHARTPLALVGGSGSGKSAILGKVWQDFRRRHRDTFILPHFVGASPSSTNVSLMLRRFCQELRKQFRLTQTRRMERGEETVPYEIPDDPVKLSETFREMLKVIPDDQRAVFIIDAVNQLDDFGGAQEMMWLPTEFPPQVKIIVSCVEEEGKSQPALVALRARRTPELPVDPLTDVERFDIVMEVPSLSAKTLDPQQIRLLMENPATRNPLYLLVALEELRGFGLFEKINERIGLFPRIEGEEGLNALFSQVIERLEDEAGGDTVRMALSLIASSRMGLSEREMQELIGGQRSEVRDQTSMELFVLLRQLRPYLLRRGELVDFYHRNLWKAATKRYLDTEDKRLKFHQQLAGYFRGQGLTSRRMLTETVHHLLAAAMWDDLEKLLTDLDFVEAKSHAGMAYGLLDEYARAIYHWPGQEEVRRQEAEREERIQRYVQGLIAHARDPDHEPLPEPPPNVISVGAAEPSGQRRGDWTPLERLEGWNNFMANHTALLAAGEIPAFQLAYNSADGGPVVKAMEQRQREGRGFRGLWLRLRNRPGHTPQPAMLKTLERHSSFVEAVALSADGRRAVSGSLDGTLLVWDVASGRCLQTLAGYSGGCRAVALSADGRLAVSGSDDQSLRGLVVSGSDDQTLRVWDLVSGRCLQTLEGHTGSVFAVALSADGRRAVSCGEDSLRVWDVASGRCLQQTFGELWGYAAAVALSADGRRAISGSPDKTLRVWDLVSGRCLQTLAGYSGGCNAVALSADGRLAVSGSDDSTLRVWDVATGRCLQTLEGHTRAILAVALSADGLRAISGSRDQTLRVWDVATGRCLQTLAGHSERVFAVALSADGRRAVSGSPDKTLRVWDLVSGRCQQTLEEHSDWVVAVVQSADGRRAISGSLDNTPRVWDVASGRCLQTLAGHTGSVFAVALSADGLRAISGSRDQTLRVWDVATGRCLQTLEGHSNSVAHVALSADGRRAVSCGEDSLRVWDLASGRCLQTLEGHSNSAGHVALSLDGKRAISGGGDQTLRVWDVASGRCLQTLAGHTDSVLAVALSADGRRAVSGSLDNTLRVWDLASGRCLQTLAGHTESVYAVALGADGRRAVSGSLDKTLRVWDLASGRCLQTLAGHTGSVFAVALSADGRRAVSGSLDNTLRVWDVPSGRSLITHFSATGGDFFCVAASALGLVAGTTSGRVELLAPENFSWLEAPPFTTVTRLWLFGADGSLGQWDEKLATVCPRCGTRFVAGRDILDTIAGITRTARLSPDQSPCLELPAEAWDEPRLFSDCPHCRQPLRFNPFLHDFRDSK